jgi:hypothetical protein
MLQLEDPLRFGRRGIAVRQAYSRQFVHRTLPRRNPSP